MAANPYGWMGNQNRNVQGVSGLSSGQMRSQQERMLADSQRMNEQQARNLSSPYMTQNLALPLNGQQQGGYSFPQYGGQGPGSYQPSQYGGGQGGFGQPGWSPQVPQLGGQQQGQQPYNRGNYGTGGTFDPNNPFGSQPLGTGNQMSGYDYGGFYNPNPYQPPGSQQQGGQQPPVYNPVGGGASNILQQWAGSPFANPSFYGNKDQSMQADRFSTNYAIPFGNLSLQQQAQDIQQAQFGVTSGMQNRVNEAGIARDIEESRRSDIGLGYGIFSGNRAFGEGQRQFDVTTGLNYAELGQRGALTREGYQSQEKIQGMKNDLERYGIDTKRMTDQEALRIQEMLGLGTQRIGERQVGVLETAEQRAGRQQMLDEAYRQRALAQEAELTRQRFQNELLQSRYGVFGRAQAPNMNIRGGWR